MTSQTRIKADLSQLEALLKKLGGEYVTRVGVIGSEAGAQHDAESGLTNAELGVLMEFGVESRNIPPRSFLRLPLETRQDILVKTLGKSSVKEKIESGDIEGVYELLGIAAESIIQDAFSSGGFGAWTPNAPATVAKKGSSAPLIDTGALRKSIRSEVVKRSELR